MFQGLSAFPITPIEQNGTFDEAGFAALLTRLVRPDVASIGVLGSTGSYAYLTPEHYEQACHVAVACVAGRTPVIAGVGALTTDAGCARAKVAARAGVDAVLLAPMSYTPLTDIEVFAHFQAISQASDLPMCIYDNPTTTGFHFSTDLLGRIAALPNVAAVKLPSPEVGREGARLQALREVAPDGFAVGFSGDACALRVMQAGADGFFSTLSGTLPEPMARMMAKAHASDTAGAGAINDQLAPLWALFAEHGGIRVVYAIANSLGLTEAQPPRPILPLTPEVRAHIDAQIASWVTP